MGNGKTSDYLKSHATDLVVHHLSYDYFANSKSFYSLTAKCGMNIIS